jgi:HlyD family secretion protein
VIVSPVAGVVTELLVKEGDLVGPSTAIMTVGNVDPMILQALVNENDIGQIQVGQTASVVPSAFPDMKLAGTVTAIDPRATVSSNVSTYQTSIQVPNRDGRLRWGMNCDAEISVMDLRNVLTLPVSAVKTSNGSSTVYIADEGKVLSWDVQTGATDGTKIQIVAGLDDGEEVLVAAKKSSTSTSNQQRQGGGMPGGVMQIFR